MTGRRQSANPPTNRVSEVHQSVTKTGLGASYRFHLSSGIRVTLGLATFQLVLLLVLVALQPPAARELLLKGLAAGRILVNGSDLWRREVAARSDLAFVPQEPDVTPFATIREVLRLVCRLRSEPVERAEFADRFLVLRDGEVLDLDSLSDAD